MLNVVRNGVRTVYHLHGAGPAVVVPQCNIDVAAYQLTPLLNQFTVLAVSPRGFMESGRMAAGSSSARQITGDIERVLDHVGIGRGRAVARVMGPPARRWSDPRIA